MMKSREMALGQNIDLDSLFMNGYHDCFRFKGDQKVNEVTLYIHDCHTHRDSVYTVPSRDRNKGCQLFFIYKLSDEYSPFTAVAKAHKKKAQNSFLQGLVDNIYFKPDGECHRRYSPNGKFLMYNSLKKKSGILYVETQIQNSITHKAIIKIDTFYQNFAGVGFAHDSSELIFLHHNVPNAKVPLYTSQERAMLNEFETIAFKNYAVTSLLERLCKECKKKGCIALSKDDPARIMLMDWWRAGTPGIKKILEICFPLQIQKN